MKLTLQKLLFGLAALGLAGALTAGLGSGRTVRAQSPDDDAAFGRLGGTWNVKVTLTNCQTGVPMGSSFSSYLSFAGNGTMAENTSNPGFAVGQRGPGLGVWSHTERQTYQAKSVAFILFTTPPAPPMNPGFTMGTQTISQTITLQGRNEFTSDATIEFADASGSVYRNGCAVASASRFQ
jgi:hypothetical protein